MADVGDSKSAFGIPLLIGAVGFGLFAALMSYFYLKSEEASLIKKYAGNDRGEVVLLVAATDLRKGTLLRQEHLSQRSIPANFAHSDAIPSAEYEKYLGRSIEVNVAAGKPILKSFLDDGFPVDFSDTVPVGRRALTVLVDDINSIAGFVRPGNRIDLFVNVSLDYTGFSSAYLTSDLVDQLPAAVRDSIPQSLIDIASSGSGDDAQIDELVSAALPEDIIMPVLQNVRVLATGREPYRENLDKLNYPQPRQERNFSTFTLDVTAREAALISAAIDKGELLAILRNRNDESMADFTKVSAHDLFANAEQMAIEGAATAARVAAAAGVDDRGNLIDADGNTLMSADQLAAAGLMVNENGEIVDANGNVVDPNDLVVTADGRVLNKQDLEKAGYTVNAAGQIVDANGNVVSAEDIVVTANGQVMTKQELAAAGLTVNENGEIVDENGRVVDPDELIKTADGKVLSAEALAAAGLSINENGEIVDANGNVVDPDSLLVSADGEVLTAEQLAAAGLSVNENGEIVDANGNVIDPGSLVTDANGNVIDQAALAAAGLTLNENGEIVDKDGNVIDSDDLVMTEGGLLSQAQLKAAGLTVDEHGRVVGADGEVLTAEQIASVQGNIPITGGSASIDMIIGGASDEGVAKSKKLRVTD